MKPLRVDAHAVWPNGQVKYMMLHEGPLHRIPLGRKSKVVDIAYFTDLVRSNIVFGFQLNEQGIAVAKYTNEEIKDNEKRGKVEIAVEGEDWYLNSIRFNSWDIQKSQLHNHVAVSMLLTSLVKDYYITSFAICKWEKFTKTELNQLKKEWNLLKISRVTDNLYLTYALTGLLEQGLRNTSIGFGINADIHNNLHSVFRKLQPNGYSNILDMEVKRIGDNFKQMEKIALQS